MFDETLPEQSLSPTEYQFIVAPSLKVAAELAAKRGDPTLHGDLSSMLALIFLINGLSRFYQDEWADLAGKSDEQALREAPMAACVMVLKQAGLEGQAIKQCLMALDGAYQQILEQKLGWTAESYIETAWRHITNEQRDLALAALASAAAQLVNAIDEWEGSRDRKH